MRAATRALVPLVGVQTGDPEARLPYVLAMDVVDCPPGEGFPVDEIAAALARVLRRDGPVLAGSLPVLRDAVEARRTVEGAVAGAALAALGRAGTAPHLPLISQSQMLSDLATAQGAKPPEDPRASLDVGRAAARRLARDQRRREPGRRAAPVAPSPDRRRGGRDRISRPRGALPSRGRPPPVALPGSVRSRS